MLPLRRIIVVSLSEICGASAIDEISPTVRQQLLTLQQIPKIQIRSPQHPFIHFLSLTAELLFVHVIRPNIYTKGSRVHV